MKAISVVSPAGKNIALGKKTLEIRNKKMGTKHRL